MFVEDLLREFTPEEHDHLGVEAHIQVAVHEEYNQWIPALLNHI